jgi:hypothetical protein
MLPFYNFSILKGVTILLLICAEITRDNYCIIVEIVRGICTEVIRDICLG